MTGKVASKPCCLGRRQDPHKTKPQRDRFPQENPVFQMKRQLDRERSSGTRPTPTLTVSSLCGEGVRSIPAGPSGGPWVLDFG
jgi:hypothetical protein